MPFHEGKRNISRILKFQTKCVTGNSRKGKFTGVHIKAHLVIIRGAENVHSILNCLSQCVRCVFSKWHDGGTAEPTVVGKDNNGWRNGDRIIAARETGGLKIKSIEL